MQGVRKAQERIEHQGQKWSLVTAGAGTTHSLRRGENNDQTQDKAGATELCEDP